jgi:hypothetical protein
MRTASLTVAAATFLAASPALATSTMVCTAAGWPGMDIAIVTGTTGVVQATISLGGEELSTVGENGPKIGQAWMDGTELKLDIVDANADQRLARLLTRRRGDAYIGTLEFRGRTIRVRCTEEG